MRETIPFFMRGSIAGWFCLIQLEKALLMREANLLGETVVFPFLSVVRSLLVAKMWKNFVGIPSRPGIESPGIPSIVLEMCLGSRMFSSEMVCCVGLGLLGGG